jgi:hypothetical protein
MYLNLILSFLLQATASADILTNTEPVKLQETIRLQLLDESSLKIKGTSTLHDWDVEAREFSVEFGVPLHWFDDDTEWEGDEISNLRVIVPVDDLDGGRSRMNRDLRNAMNAEEYPEIEFDWSEIVIEKNEGNDFLFKVNGSVSIAGETRDIMFESRVYKTDQNTINASGEVGLNMRDFGIDPPRALLGAIRTGEEITVVFDIVLERRD